MMSDAVDDAMEAEDEGEGEEMEGDKILKEVLDEIGMNMNEAVRFSPLPGLLLIGQWDKANVTARLRANCQSIGK
jgi:hypothetical protein